MYLQIEGMTSPYLRLTLRDLKTLSNLSNNSITLGRRQLMILYYFAENPGTSAYDISPVINKKDYKATQKSYNDYTDARRRIKRLKDLELIEKVEKSNIHDAQYHKLSERGIYYIISNNLRFQFGQYDIFYHLFKNYGDHPLFQYFLYPCIERNTLSKIRDTAIFSHVFSYLHDCCKKVEETIYMVSHPNNQTQNGYVTRRLFSWDLSKEDKDNLRSFLKQRFEWNWVEYARVTKAKDQSSVEISDGRNSAFIKLNPDKTKAILKRKKLPSLEEKEICKFVVNGSYVCTSEPYRFYLRTLDPSRMPPPMSFEESHMEFFHFFITMRIRQLALSIQSNYVEPGYSAAIQILRHDPKFVQVWKETKDQFDKNSAFFM
jgi:hypothetical protein